MALNRSAHSLSPTDYTPSSLSFPVFSAPPSLLTTGTLQRTSASRPSIKILQQQAPRHPMSAVPLTPTFFSTLPPIPLLVCRRLPSPSTLTRHELRRASRRSSRCSPRSVSASVYRHGLAGGDPGGEGGYSERAAPVAATVSVAWMADP